MIDLSLRSGWGRGSGRRFPATVLRVAFDCGGCPGSRFCDTLGAWVWTGPSSFGEEELLSLSLSMSLPDVDESLSGSRELDSK